MNTVPQIISTKDLSYISDMINWNITAGKCANHYSNECTNDNIKQIMDNVYNMHRKHIQLLIHLLEEENNE